MRQQITGRMLISSMVPMLTEHETKVWIVPSAGVDLRWENVLEHRAKTMPQSHGASALRVGHRVAEVAPGRSPEASSERARKFRSDSGLTCERTGRAQARGGA